jgi:hypothetical protein
MPDSMGAKIPTARHRRMSERPNEPVLQSRKESDHALRCNLDWQCKLIFSCIVLERLARQNAGDRSSTAPCIGIGFSSNKRGSLGERVCPQSFSPSVSTVRSFTRRRYELIFTFYSPQANVPNCSATCRTEITPESPEESVSAHCRRRHPRKTTPR